MANSISALDKIIQTGRFGNLQNGRATITLQDIQGMQLTQLAAFPHQKSAFHAYFTEELQSGLPQAGKISKGKYSLAKTKQAVCFSARLDPSKVMLISSGAIPRLPSEFYPLDLSDARTVLKIQGENATTLLARLCAVDLSEAAFPDGSFAMTGMHHVSVSIWRHQNAYLIFLPRSFAASLYHLIFEISEQFGCEVLKSDVW